MSRDRSFITNEHTGKPDVAKTTPIEFINQVQAERKKITWPTWKETWMTGLMVVIMTTILALFFLGVDSFFNAVVSALLKLAQ
nr:preprotein translocase subunit SecE [Sphingomonas sp. BT552]